MSIINKTDDRRAGYTGARFNDRSSILEDSFHRRTTEKLRSVRKKDGKSRLRIKEFLLNHIGSNIKEYIIVIIIFLIGITAGVIFINNINENQVVEVQEYINNFIDAIKGEYHVDTTQLLKSSLTENLKLVICMWFIGSTVIGMPIVLGIVLFRGFCIGYTISASIAVLGTQKGIIFFLTTIFLQDIIFIPVLLALAVSGIRLYQSIMKDKRKENIKIEVIRHTLCSLILFGLLVISSFTEVYISSNLLTSCINFF